ncbi:MAG: hypothetical protein AAFP26_04785 [Planctomycetota bacterium]
MLFSVLFILGLAISLIAGIAWLVLVALRDPPYATKSDDPIPPLEGPERDPSLDRPVSIDDMLRERGELPPR